MMKWFEPYFFIYLFFFLNQTHLRFSLVKPYGLHFVYMHILHDMHINNESKGDYLYLY